MIHILIVISYLLGSIPFGLIVTQLAGSGDIRLIGSGNIGATNVLRTGNKMLAALTLLLDMIKGTTAVILPVIFEIYEAAPFCAMAVVIGHMYPLWIKFKGGKGVATALGAYLALSPPVALSAAGIWLFIAVMFRISSVSAMVAFACTPVLFFAFQQKLYIDMSLIVLALILFKHKPNIKRLMVGTEPRIGESKHAKKQESDTF